MTKMSIMDYNGGSVVAMVGKEWSQSHEALG
jgi:hypothetical protein